MSGALNWYWHALAYDSARGRVVLFSGHGTSDYLSDTWEYHFESTWPDEVCDNGADDDRDGLTDCADPDCEGKPSNSGVCSGGVCQ